MDLLERCKAQGDVLVLGLNSDESVKRQGKGDDRPVNPYPVRAFVLAHLESVDFVVRFDEDTPAKLIEAVQPDVLVKGGDWSVDRIVGRESVQRRGGEVISLPLLQGYSTTTLIEKIPPHRSRQPLIFLFPPRQAAYEKMACSTLTAATPYQRGMKESVHCLNRWIRRQYAETPGWSKNSGQWKGRFENGSVWR